MTTKVDVNAAINSQDVFEKSPVTKRKVTDLFTREEIQQLTQRSDVMGFWALFVVWFGVVLIMLGMAWVSQMPLWIAIPGVILGMALLGGRQLSMSIIVHDASHGTLFKTKWFNTTLTDWLCAKPLWNDMKKYRAYHFVHHTKTGTDEDPDLILRNGYPTTPSSMMRKFRRDLTGVPGVKYLIGRILMDMELMQWNVTGEIKWLPREGKRSLHFIGNLLKNSFPMVLINTLFIGVLVALDHLWLYACWVGAHVTFFMFFMRIRSMAEHAATERCIDMFKNTRTVKAGWIARMFVAPIGVNYHMEHHILASCPYFNLAKAHQLLRERNGVPKPPSYWEMLKIMMTPTQSKTSEPISEKAV